MLCLSKIVCLQKKIKSEFGLDLVFGTIFGNYVRVEEKLFCLLFENLLVLAAPDQQHRIATNIYTVYITSFGSAIVDEIDNEIIHRMKSFLVAEYVKIKSIELVFQ